MSDCPVCLIPHDPAIHKATMSVRKWLKQQVKLSLQAPAKVTKRKPRPDGKGQDLVLNFANHSVTRRFPTRSMGDGANHQL